MRRRTASLAAYLEDADALLPPHIPENRAIAQIAALHATNGGATHHPRFGDMQGQPLYAVSLYPDRSVRQRGVAVREKALRAFMARNADILDDPRNAVGTWYDAESGVTYLDVVTLVPDREHAVRLAREYNQVAVYDLEQSIEIKTGGTGEASPGMPPPPERLLPLVRAQRRRRKSG